MIFKDQESIFSIAIMASKIKTCSLYIPKVGTSSPYMVLRVAHPSVSAFSACALPHGISSFVSGGSLCACALVWLSGYKCGSYIQTKWLELFQCWGCSLSLWYECVSFHRAARRELVKDVFLAGRPTHAVVRDSQKHWQLRSVAVNLQLTK